VSLTRVIGVDDIPAAVLAAPPLTTVDFHPSAIGRHLAAIVLGAWLTTDHRRQVSTLDLGGHGRFTVFTGIGGDGWLRAAAEVGNRLGVEVAAVVIGPGRDYDDLYGDWARVRGIEDGGVLLARPDNYVAYRHATTLAEAEAVTALEEALRRVLDRPEDART
jgi:2,4-dichlorophenol 6-monooxygenase